MKTTSEKGDGQETDFRRMAAAIEKIRDHYYSPPKPWKKILAFIISAIALVSSYTVIVRAVEDWYWDTHQRAKMAKRCAEVAHRLFAYEGDAIGAMHFLKKAKDLDAVAVRYRLELDYVKSMLSITDLFDLTRPLTPEERAHVDAALAESMFLLETAPNEPMSHALAAQAYALLGAKEDALAAAERAVALAPNESQMHVIACQSCYTVGDFAGARRYIEKAGCLHPRPPLVFFWKGHLALTVDRDVAAARAFFEEMVLRAPRLALSHAALGKAMLAEENPDFKAAAAAFERALALDPEFYSASLGMGEIAVRTDDWSVARLWYDRVLRQDPDCITALEARARLNVHDGDWTAAVADWSAAIALAPFRADLYRERAAAYAGAKDEQHAAADRKMSAALERKNTGCSF